MITVKNKAILDTLHFSVEDEYALVEDEKKLYQFHNGQWEVANIANGEFTLTLAELNASVFEQLSAFTENQLKDALSVLFQYFGETLCLGDYWALICWDKKYITILHNDETKSNECLNDIVIEIVTNLGDVKDITLNKNTNAVEIWVTEKTGTYCYILFNYTNGIVEGVA